MNNPSVTVLEQCTAEQKWSRGAMTRAMLYVQVSVRCAPCWQVFACGKLYLLQRECSRACLPAI